MAHIPVIDISPLLQSFTTPEALRVSQEIYDACCSWGFFQIVGHSVAIDLQADLLRYTKDFFELSERERLAMHVRKGGIAWRGYIPYGGEGTRGYVDQKSGIYFGPEHPADHPQARLPLHGKNQFPDERIPEMRRAVLEYIKEVLVLGDRICAAISVSMGFESGFFRDKYLKDEPVAFFRTWRYQLGEEAELDGPMWGIGEHSDFGLLTFLKQESAGLQIVSPDGEWVDVPVIENAIVCNVGDMLDRITGGRFKSTFHRVAPPPLGAERFSFPLFFDFSWTADMVPLPLNHLPPLSQAEEAAAEERWKKTTFTSVSGKWSQYLGKKVQKVFPQLKIPDFEPNGAASSRFVIAVPLEA